MSHKHPTPNRRGKQRTHGSLVTDVAPLEAWRDKYVSANSKARVRIRTELDAKLEELEDLDFPDVAVCTLEGKTVEEIASLLDKSPRAIKEIQREINALLAA